jgi:hypothetical protein
MEGEMRSLTGLVLTMALLAAACSGGDDGAESSTTTTTAAPTSAESTTTTAARTTTTAAAARQEGAECLIGQWELDSQLFFDSLFETFGGELGMEDAAFEHVSGTYRVSMTGEGGYTGTRDEWTFRFSIPEGGFQTIIDGTDAGSYTVDGDQLTISDVVSETDVSFFAEADGEMFEVPSGPGVPSDALGGQSTFTCSGDALTVENEGIVAPFVRIG